MLDFSTWNLSIPEPTPAAQVIKTEQLLKGYKSPYFYPTSDGSGIVFWAPVIGGHTKTAHYPRSELRETHADGSLYNWKYSETNSSLNSTLEVNQIPSSQKIIIGQIHGWGEDGATPLIKLQYRYKDKGEGLVETLVRQKPDDKDSPSTVLLRGIPLNSRFDYSITLSSAGLLQVEVVRPNGERGHFEVTLDASWKDHPMYFKAGAYVQDNEGSSSEGGKVTFYKATIEHAR